MDIAKFFIQLGSVPFVVLKTIAQYYTTGTIFSRTNVEFSNSLRKNITLAIEGCLAKAISPRVVRLFAYQPFTKVIERFRNNPMTLGLNNYGKKIDDHGYWVVENESCKDVLIFLHGGGFLLHIFDAQMAGILAAYHSIDKEKRQKISVAILDYSLTCHGNIYPTQIHELLSLHKSLADQGYKNIHFIGDSAGSNLALAVSRFTAYPEVAQQHFSQFTQFDWNFGSLIQPKSILLISPWVQPLAKAELRESYGVSFEGDLGARDGTLGSFYIPGLEPGNINDWITFTNTNFEDHWAEVDAIAQGRTLLIYGEREVLRSGVEKFIEIINKNANIQVKFEKGGIHDGIFYVESLDFISNKGGSTALSGGLDGKFGLNHVGKFLSELL